MDTKSTRTMEAETVSNCSQCGDPACLMMHEWTSSQDENREITAEDCIQSILDGITTKDLDAFFCDDEKEKQQPHPPPPKMTRFYDASEEELVTACKEVVQKNTQSNNRWALNNFEAWRAAYNNLHPDSPFTADILMTSDTAALDKCLSRYVVETRKEDGSPFPAKTIKLLLSGLQRHMRTTSETPFNIFDIKDHRFRDFHSTCDTVFKKLLSKGVGAEVRHHEAFTPEDEDTFCDKGVFATDSPTGLQNAIFYYTGKNLCLCGGEEHRNLKCSQFVEIEGGYRYVERGSKTFRGGFSQLHLNGKSVVLYNDADAGMRCYCSLLRFYLSKLPSDTSDAFYLQPVKGAPKAEKWYCNIPVGRNKLATMVKRMCEQAGLKPKTNHSLRATGATTLFNAGVPEKLVQEVTGHRSIECLRRYEKTSEQHKRAVSRSLTSRQNFEAQSLNIKQTVVSSPSPSHLQSRTLNAVDPASSLPFAFYNTGNIQNITINYSPRQ